MIFCPPTKNALYFSSIQEIDLHLLEEIGCLQDMYCNPNYLLALEKNHPDIIFSYIILIDSHQKPIAFVCLQIIDFYLDSVKNNLQTFLKKIKSIGRKIGIFPKEKPFKILVLGNAFVSGERGIFLKQNQNKKLIINKLAKSITYFVNYDYKFAKKIDAYLLKDYVDESLQITDELIEFNYHAFSVEPNMQLILDKNWEVFDDYLLSMKTKFRVKAKKALQQSMDLNVVEINSQNIHQYIPKMTALYKKVAQNATFNLVDFNLDTYIELTKYLNDSYFIKCYFLDDKLVGFLSGLFNNNELDAHFVGIDYELNKTYAIYQRMLYDYIKIAITKKVKLINFGRTASEIKSSVGAIPQNLTMYLRHKKSIHNKIMKPFIQKIQPTPFQQKIPFKTTNPQ